MFEDGGDGGIRTLGARLGHAPLAGVWFQPTHPRLQVSFCGEDYSEVGLNKSLKTGILLYDLKKI